MFDRRSMSFALVIVVLPAFAFGHDRGSQQDQEACTPDVFRLCGDAIPDEGRIVACLQAKKAQLSPLCLPVIFPPDPNASGDVHTRHRARRHQE